MAKIKGGVTRMRVERLRRGWTGAELARRACLPAADLSRIERGLLVPYDPQARRLEEALGGIPIEVLLAEAELVPADLEQERRAHA